MNYDVRLLQSSVRTAGGTGIDIDPGPTASGDAFVAPIDGEYSVRVVIEGLNAAAATITAYLYVSGSIYDMKYSEAKYSTSATTHTVRFYGISLNAGDSVEVYLSSSNTSDDDVTATTNWYISSEGLPTLNETTIATYSSQTSFALTAGSAVDDAYNGCYATIRDADTDEVAYALISDYTGSSKTVALSGDHGIFTMADGDVVKICGPKNAIFGNTVSLDGAQPTVFGAIAKLADDNGGATFDATTDSLNKKSGSAFKRGVAVSNLTFLMTKDRAPVSGATISSTIKKDAGAFGSTSNTATSVANGIYTIDLTASEMTASIVTLRFTATGCDDLTLTIPVGA